MDKFKNIYQVESAQDQSYIKLELDVSGVNGTPPAAKARLNVYRAGYTDTDTPSKPLRTFEISTDVVNNANKNSEHTIDFHSAFGQIALSIDAMHPSPVRSLPLRAAAPAGVVDRAVRLRAVAAADGVEQPTPSI